MTDLPTPPPPGPGAPPPPAYGPPPGYGPPPSQQQPYPPQPGYPQQPYPHQPYPQQPYPQYNFPYGASPTIPERRPRPKSPVGALLLIGGAGLHILSAYLPWYERGGESLNGMDTFIADGGTSIFEGPGKAFVFFGIVVAGLGIAAFFAGRQIALAIVTLVVAVIGALFSLIGVAVVEDQKEFAELFGADPGSTGIGVILGIIGMLVAVAGAIVVLAKRRPPPVA